MSRTLEHISDLVRVLFKLGLVTQDIGIVQEIFNQVGLTSLF